MSELIGVAKELSGLSTAALVILAMVAAGMKIWGWTWQHDRELLLKDALIKSVSEDRDYWRAQAVAGAATAQVNAEHVRDVTAILASVTAKP